MPIIYAWHLSWTIFHPSSLTAQLVPMQCPSSVLVSSPCLECHLFLQLPEEESHRLATGIKLSPRSLPSLVINYLPLVVVDQIWLQAGFGPSGLHDMLIMLSLAIKIILCRYWKQSYQLTQYALQGLCDCHQQPSPSTFQTPQNTKNKRFLKWNECCNTLLQVGTPTPLCSFSFRNMLALEGGS